MWDQTLPLGTPKETTAQPLYKDTPEMRISSLHGPIYIEKTWNEDTSFSQLGHFMLSQGCPE